MEKLDKEQEARMAGVAVMSLCSAAKERDEL